MATVFVRIEGPVERVDASVSEGAVAWLALNLLVFTLLA